MKITLTSLNYDEETEDQVKQGDESFLQMARI